MHEILFSSSPITIIFSATALLLTFALPTILGQKTGLKRFPKAIYQLMLICIFWNTSSFVGGIFFGGTEFSLAAKILFGVQAIAWVQAGNAIYHICADSLKLRRSNFWRLLNALGAANVIAVTTIFCLNESFFTQFTILGIRPFQEFPYFNVYSILFFIFVVPNLVLTIFKLTRNTLQTSSKDVMQINFYATTSFTFFVLFSFLLDYVLPVSCSFNVNGNPPVFLQFHQYSCIFLAILCAQYFTSISFKNKSSNWLMKSLMNQLSDCAFTFQPDGRINSSNSAAQLLFRMSESEMKMHRIQDLIPNILLENEVFRENEKIQINDEIHTFNISLYKYRTTLSTFMWFLLLSDQTKSLFYQQRIKTLNSQFTEYKKDLIRYQDRLDSSEKKFKEQNNFSSTLINALPFQFWSKNEQGVYMTQNIMDIRSRGNLIQTTDSPSKISYREMQARNNGLSNIHTS